MRGAADAAVLRSGPPSAGQDKADRKTRKTRTDRPRSNLPVSLDKISEALQQPPTLSLRTLDERPTFRVQILERQKIEELLATLNFKSRARHRPAASTWLRAAAADVSTPSIARCMQPYAAFSSGELLTILIENLVGKYLGGKAINAVSKPSARAPRRPRKEEVRSARRAVLRAQPNSAPASRSADTAR